jgi:hypothetical protein
VNATISQINDKSNERTMVTKESPFKKKFRGKAKRAPNDKVAVSKNCGKKRAPPR